VVFPPFKNSNPKRAMFMMLYQHAVISWW
jgi:hypothetical protein